MKTSCFKRTLAILLSVFLAVPLFMVATFAEDIVFVDLPQATDECQPGDLWYDSAALAQATGTNDYLDAVYYLSEDGDTLKIEVLANDDTIVTEFHQRDTEPVYFDYLRVLPSFGDPLPTSDEGLADGDYWFDQAALIALLEIYGMEEDYITAVMNATFHLSVDGTILRMAFRVDNSNEVSYEDEFLAEPDYLCSLLRQAGVDPNEGFTLLPTSDEGLENGDYWFDAASFLLALDEKERAIFQNAQYYLSEDGVTLRISVGASINITRAEEPEIFSFLHQVGDDSNEGFILLPTSADGLAEGAYWFDLAGLIEATGENDLQTAVVYLSTDGNVIRFVVLGETLDFAVDGENGDIVFYFLKQAGETDPNAGFTLLPTSADGLAEGEYWYDLAGYAAEMGGESFLTAQVYLRDDGKMLRMVIGNNILEYPKDKANSDYYYRYLHQVGETPREACLTLSASADTVRLGNTFTVTVDLTQNPGLAGMTLSLLYDADVLTLTDVQTSGMLDTGNLTLGGNLNATPYNILWDDATSHDVHTETGTILTLTFTVKDTAAAGETTVTLTYDEESVFDIDLQSVPLVITNALLMVDTRLPGDADGDGELDLADVAVLIRFLAGGWGVTVNEENCDVNGDSEIDLKDVILIRRFLAGGWGVELM